MVRIAIDAMGGDYAPQTIVDGALSAVRRLGIGLTLVGDRSAIEQQLARHRDAARLNVEVVEAAETIGMADSPAAALRRKPHASIRVAAASVASGRAAAVFSAGNTGVTVMAAHSEFGMIAGVDRPALPTTIPTRERPAVLVDVGANADCRPQHLVQFAVMGSVYARVALGVERPRVGLLSIGEEESKGNRMVLFPIRLDDTVLNTRDDWAAKIKRRRHIGDFSNWKDKASYQKAFERLLRDLKAVGEEVT